MSADSPIGDPVGRRSLLRKAAAAGTIAWVAPIALGSTARAGVFTTKCTPPLATAGAFSWSKTGCGGAGTTITIVLPINIGACPCGGTRQACVSRGSLAGTTLTVTGLLIIIRTTTTFTGSVTFGCTDRDGDVRWARYTWSVSGTDNGGSCGSQPTNVTFNGWTGPTITNGGPCSAAAIAAATTSEPVPALSPTSGSRTGDPAAAVSETLDTTV